ncbi:MAG: DsbA family protein [Patescibacteria group bacterium]|jgi:protein-disulfide isomerase
MADNKKNFFDMSPTQSLVMGLSWGVAVISIIGLIFVLASGQSAGKAKQPAANANVNANTNVAPTPTPTPTPADTGDVTKLSPVSASDYIRGDKNAKVTLIVISDFQCPYCQRHEATLTQVMKDYSDKIRVVWRNFPLTTIHPYAQKAAEASECAGEQGKFWEYHDKLFENQSALTVDNLKSYAKDLGLNTSKFNDCLDSGKYTDLVNKEAQEAQAAGVSGTPGTFVNDQLVKGAYPYETFKQLIDAELAK